MHFVWLKGGGRSMRGGRSAGMARDLLTDAVPLALGGQSENKKG